MSRSILLFLVLLSVFLLQQAPVRWPPNGFALREGYGIVWDERDSHIWRLHDDGSFENVTQQPGIGTLTDAAMTDRFIFAQNYPDSSYETAEPDYSLRLWTIIDCVQHVTYGPYSENKFPQKLAQLNFHQPLVWKTVRQLYQDALRDGRADRSYIGKRFRTQLLWAAVTSVLISPLLLLVAIAVAYKVKRWRFRNTLLLIWVMLLVLVFTYISARFFMEWHQWRRLW